MGNEVFARTVADGLARRDHSILTSAEMQFIRLVSQGEGLLAYLLQLPNLIDVTARQPYFANNMFTPGWAALRGTYTLWCKSPRMLRRHGWNLIK
jgi:hypothetical protein